MAKPRVSRHDRQRIIDRAGALCEYCRSPLLFSTAPFSIEHIEPQARGGRTTLANLALSCQGCNGHKSTRTTALDPVAGQSAPLYHPRRDRWRDHFAWNADFSEIVGLTPTGRATVDALHLNREGVVNLRRALHLIDCHPPAEPER